VLRGGLLEGRRFWLVVSLLVDLVVGMHFMGSSFEIDLRLVEFGGIVLGFFIMHYY